MKSRKCEHGMMPWECFYCDEIEETEEARKYRNSIIDECINAVKDAKITMSFAPERVAVKTLEQLKK